MKKVLILGLLTLTIGLFGCGGGGGGGDDSNNNNNNNPPVASTDISKVAKTNISNNTKYLFVKEGSIESSSLSVNVNGLDYDAELTLYQMLQDGSVGPVNFYDVHGAIVDIYGQGGEYCEAIRINTTRDGSYVIITFQYENGVPLDTYNSVLIRISDGAVYYIGPKNIDNGQMYSNGYYGYFGDSSMLWEMGFDCLYYSNDSFLQQDSNGNIYYYGYNPSNSARSVFKLSNIGTTPSEQAITGSSENCNSFMVESNGNVLLTCYLGNNYDSQYIKVRRSDGTYSSEDERTFLQDTLLPENYYSAPIFIGSNGKINYLSFNLDAMIDPSSWDLIYPSCGMNPSDSIANVFVDYLDTTLPEITSGSNYATIPYLNQSVVTNLLTTTINREFLFPLALLDVNTNYLLYLGFTKNIAVEQEEIQDEWNNCSYVAVNSVTVNGIPLNLSEPDWQNDVDGEWSDFPVSIFKVGAGNNNIEQATFSDLSKFIKTQKYNGLVYFLAKKKSNTNRDIIYRYTPATNTLDVIYSANTSDIEIFKMEVDANGVFVYAINQLNGSTIYGKIEGGAINQLQTVDLDGPVDLIRLL